MRLVSSAIGICAGLGISSMFLPVASANDWQLIQDGAYELTPYSDVSDDNLMSHRSVVERHVLLGRKVAVS